MQRCRDANRYEEQIISREEKENAKEKLRKECQLGQILGESRAIREIHKKIEQVSSCDVNVLLTGESGTGKELVARAIHYLSARTNNPFIPVNCGAIPDNLFENELFGHVKGAFTDACVQQTGLVKEAEGGTLFLDEISTIKPYIQVKLLRLLQEGEYRPLGDSKNYKTNIKVIAATNKPLIDLLENGSFRDDLYYRLNIVSFYIPPLRERKKDIPILVDYFLKKYTRKYNKPDIKVSPKDLEAFMAYSWRGNIRELENMIQQLVVMSTSSKPDIKEFLSPPDQPVFGEFELEYFKSAKKKIIEGFERSYLRQVLTLQNGNVPRAAKQAGKSRTALWNLIKKYDMSPEQFR